MYKFNWNLYEKRQDHLIENTFRLTCFTFFGCFRKFNKSVYTPLCFGIEDAIDSKYATSKLDGEKRVRKNFPKSVILKPSIVYSVDDNFTTNFMRQSILPVMPLYYSGKTKFTLFMYLIYLILYITLFKKLLEKL